MRNSTICATMTVAAVALTSLWAISPTHADDTSWRDGWCYEGEGISVVVDWHQAPAEAGTPAITDGSTHIVRCVPLPDGQWLGKRVDALALSGITYVELGSDYVTSINGLSEIMPLQSWNIRVGAGTQWVEGYDPQRGTHDSIAFTYWNQESDPDRPYPVVNPAPIPTPDPTDEPTEEPTDEPEPTQAPSTPGPGDGPTGTGTPTPTSTGTGTPPPTQAPTAEPVPSEQPTTPEPTTQEPTTQPPTTPPPPTATPTPPSATPTTSVSVTPSSATPTLDPKPDPTSPQPSPPDHPNPDDDETAEPVWAAEPVTRVPAGTVGQGEDAPWAGLVIGGAFTAVTAGGVVLIRRLRHLETGSGRVWGEE